MEDENAWWQQIQLEERCCYEESLNPEKEYKAHIDKDTVTFESEDF